MNKSAFLKLLLKLLSWRLIKLLIHLQFPQVKQLSTEDLTAWLAAGDTKPLLLDARTLEEYEVSHLKNARLVPENLQNLIDRQKIDFTTPIVVYWSVGYRSGALAKQLQSLGYQNVFNLSGSIFQWVNENRPIYREGKQVDRVHPYQKLWGHLLNEQYL